MNLLSEGNSEPRILSARHVIGKSWPEMNKAETTLSCYDNLAPDVGYYNAALGNYAWVTWACAALMVAVICTLYVYTLREVRQHWGKCSSNVAIVVALNPVVAASSLVAIIVPRAFVLCEAVSMQMVMIAMYHFFCMILAECGGPEQLVRMSDNISWKTRVPPCCCLPFCLIPQPLINTRNLSWVRYSILQTTIVHGLSYFLMLVLWAEDVSLYLDSSKFLQPFGGVSTLFGIWGLFVCVKTVETLGFQPGPRFNAIHAVLIVVTLQYQMVKSVTGLFNIPCVLSLHPAVYVNLVQNSIIIVEMLVISLWTYRIYSCEPGKPAVLQDTLVTRG
ncbi:organic solute transporter alpha-like protein [Plodia interpunctella]|uniref:organic solute transporter alpha-like protein n=1 Tax=Plodia interpunctella TaxID=58824 RepID=UPI002367FBE0|nr:organic solute transporter alpha-like protein [Plodia interpunctella]